MTFTAYRILFSLIFFIALIFLIHGSYNIAVNWSINSPKKERKHYRIEIHVPQQVANILYHFRVR
jgi:hypothetical protein